MTDPGIPTFSIAEAAQTPAVEPPAVPSPAPEPVLSQYAQDLLGAIPEADREIVNRYIPQWDAGISSRVLQLEQTYGPAVQLLNNGWDPEDLQQAAQLMDALNTNPEAAIEAIQKAWSVQVQQQAPPTASDQPTVQLPPEVTSQLGDMSKFMQQIALREQERQQAEAQANEEKALEDYLTFLKQEKGDFDEQFVLTRMSMGVDGALAVDEFNKIIQSRLSAQGGGQQLPAPPILTGGSAVPGSKPIHQASDADRRAAVQQLLIQANQQAS